MSIDHGVEEEVHMDVCKTSRQINVEYVQAIKINKKFFIRFDDIEHKASPTADTIVVRLETSEIYIYISIWN